MHFTDIYYSLIVLKHVYLHKPETCFLHKCRKVIGSHLVSYFASHVMCRKHVLYKSSYVSMLPFKATLTHGHVQLRAPASYNVWLSPFLATCPARQMTTICMCVLYSLHVWSHTTPLVRTAIPLLNALKLLVMHQC